MFEESEVALAFWLKLSYGGDAARNLSIKE